MKAISRDEGKEQNSIYRTPPICLALCWYGEIKKPDIIRRYQICGTLSADSEHLYPFYLVKYVFFKKKKRRRWFAYKRTLKISGTVSLSLPVSRHNRVEPGSASAYSSTFHARLCPAAVADCPGPGLCSAIWRETPSKSPSKTSSCWSHLPETIFNSNPSFLKEFISFF